MLLSDLDLAALERERVLKAAARALDGSFRLELERTKPYGYSIFQLDNMALLCQVLSKPGEDLWSTCSPTGAGFARRWRSSTRFWPISPSGRASPMCKPGTAGPVDKVKMPTRYQSLVS